MPRAPRRHGPRRVCLSKSRPLLVVDRKKWLGCLGRGGGGGVPTAAPRPRRGGARKRHTPRLVERAGRTAKRADCECAGMAGGPTRRTRGGGPPTRDGGRPRLSSLRGGERQEKRQSVVMNATRKRELEKDHSHSPPKTSARSTASAGGSSQSARPGRGGGVNRPASEMPASASQSTTASGGAAHSRTGRQPGEPPLPAKRPLARRDGAPVGVRPSTRRPPRRGWSVDELEEKNRAAIGEAAEKEKNLVEDGQAVRSIMRQKVGQ